MGSYAEEQRLVRYLVQGKEDCELKTIDIKRLFNIPVLYIKQSK